MLPLLIMDGSVATLALAHALLSPARGHEAMTWAAAIAQSTPSVVDAPQAAGASEGSPELQALLRQMLHLGKQFMRGFAPTRDAETAEDWLSQTSESDERYREFEAFVRAHDAAERLARKEGEAIPVSHELMRELFGPRVAEALLLPSPLDKEFAEVNRRLEESLRTGVGSSRWDFVLLLRPSLFDESLRPPPEVSRHLLTMWRGRVASGVFVHAVATRTRLRRAVAASLLDAVVEAKRAALVLMASAGFMVSPEVISEAERLDIDALVERDLRIHRAIADAPLFNAASAYVD